MEKRKGLVINNCYKAESMCQELVHLFLLASTREGDIIPALQMWKSRKWPLSRDREENMLTSAELKPLLDRLASENTNPINAIVYQTLVGDKMTNNAVSNEDRASQLRETLF